MSRIDYDLSKIKGIAFDIDGVLSPSTVPISKEGTPIRMGNVKDGYAIQLAVKKGIHIAVISGGKSEEMTHRMELLKVNDLWQGIKDKLPVLVQWMQTRGLKPEEVAFMGDDIPDLRCLRAVGLPCSPFDAAWEAKQESRYISPFSGGYGAARDLIEQVMKARNLWNPEDSDCLIW